MVVVFVLHPLFTTLFSTRDDAIQCQPPVALLLLSVGGLAGLVAAFELSKRNVRSVIVDQESKGQSRRAGLLVSGGPLLRQL